MSESTTQSAERTTLVYDDDGLGRPPWAMSSPLLKEYYDTEWGLPIFEEGRILVVVETLLMFRLSLSVRPFSRLVFGSPGFCGGGG